VTEKEPESTSFEPRIVAFLCNWCSYAGADMAGVSRYQYPTNIRVIRVMCSARVDAVAVLRGFLYGADGMFVSGCHLGDCHYISGNYHAEKKIKMTKKLLQLVGLDEERLFLDWVSAAEGQRFANLVAEFVKKIKAIGPLAEKEGLGQEDLTRNLSAAIEAASTDRLRWLVGREYDLVTKDNSYGEPVPQDSFDSVMDDAIRQEYVKASIAQVLKDGPMSVKDLAQKIGASPRKILINLMEMRMKGRLTSSGARGRSPLYSLR
jgi:coenzyme F420-reducing hydrogenase delta subunit